VWNGDQACIPYNSMHDLRCNACSSAIASKALSNAILVTITISFCVIAPKVHESKYKILLQAFGYNVALHVTTIMFGYCNRWRCGAWWTIPTSITRRRKEAMQQRTTTNEKTIMMVAWNLQLPIISNSLNIQRCILYHHQPQPSWNSLANTQGSSQSFSQLQLFYSMLQHL